MMSKSNPSPKIYSTIIVGAGWAGLSAAFTLVEQGQQVILLEAAPQSGGRARSISFGEHTVDNGQHLCMGAYHHILSLLKALNIPEDEIFYRTPLDFFTFDLKDPKSSLQIKLPKLPYSLQWLLGFLNMRGISISERFQILRFFYILLKKGFHLDQDTSVLVYLRRLKQSERLITKLWRPMVLAALSTPIEEASTQVFLQILKDIFSSHSTDSDYLFPKVDLSQCLPQPILKYLNTKNNKIHYNQRITQLIIENGKCQGVYTTKEKWLGHSVILATPPHTTAQILGNGQPPSACTTLINNLLKFHYQPITTVYLQYSGPITVKKPMLGIINGISHWVFDRKITGQPHILSVVITGVGPHNELGNEMLVKKITQEIAPLISTHNENLVHSRVICEKRAAFSCEVDIESYRPSNKTPIENLWIAGDYTKTNYPATLEGAVKSGVMAAELSNGV